MYDGAVVFDTRLNNKTLEKDYAKAVRKLEKMEKHISDTTGKRNGLAEQAKKMAAELDVAKAKLYEMQTASKGVFKPEQIQTQRENVRYLQAEWNAVQSQVEKCDRQIAASNEKLDAEKKKVGRITEKMEEAAAAQNSFSDATDGATVRMDKLLTRIKGLATRVLVFSLITQGLRLMRDWLGEVVTKNDQTAAAIARLKGALLTLAQPLLQVVIPVFTALVNLLTAVIGKIAAFLSMLGGKTVQESSDAAKALNNQADAYGGVADAAKKAQKQLMGFDEINKLESADTSAAGGGGGTASGEIAPDFSWAAGVSEVMEKISGWVLAIAAGLALWKISSFIPGTLGMILGTIGKLVAGVGLVGLGFTLMSEGFKDAAENGLTLENVLTIIAGIIATGLGISVLTGSLIPLLVAGILSVLLAITTLTGHGGELLEGLKQVFGGLSDFVTGVFAGDWEKAWAGIVNAGRGAVNVLISIINSMIDLVVSGLNMISFDVPEWIPVIGGSHVGFNIQSAPQIPYLAQGAVIPPNRQFLAVLGDQTHGTNVEAPLDTIKQAVAEVLAQYGGGVTDELLRELIDTVRAIRVGDEVIGKAATRYQNSRNRATGG